MSKKNTILLLTCVALIFVCACSSAQNSLSVTKQDTSQNISDTPVVATQIVSNEATQNNGQTTNRANYKPKDGYVPDEQTAIAIAVAVWTPIYGKEKIEDEKPYKVQLKNGIWTVTGSLPEGFDGGVAEIDISKMDGRILRVIHGK